MLVLSRLQLKPNISIYHLAKSAKWALFRPASSQSSARSKPPNPYAHTVLLPQTDLPTKHSDQAAVDRRLKERTTTALYRKQWEDRSNDLFILHDGPPYANGHLHMGHALNRILKDMITRFKVLRGHRVHYVPGWDCHGLPIEQKALSEVRKSHSALDPKDIRKVARQSAEEAIEVQKAELKDFGVMADWESPLGTYRTMDHDFEIRELRIFQHMVKNGLISYHLRPTFYSPALRTALAESELSYQDDHESRSVYVAYPVAASDMSPPLREVWKDVGSPSLRLPIWTTTPWSLPGNLGVAISPKTQYCIVQTDLHAALILAEDCVVGERKDGFEKLFGKIRILGRISGQDMVGTAYTHPFHPASAPTPKPIVFPSKFVNASTGTGLVHSAPAHGFEDYEAFQEAGLSIEKMRSPIDKAGTFTVEVREWCDHPIAKELVGEAVQGHGTEMMIQLFKAEGLLLGEETIKHRYPYAWKAKKPIITIGMRQWFADIGPVKSDAMKAIDTVKFHPAHAHNRLRAHVEPRSEWCISRQRSWGVPIPALYQEDGTPLTDESSIGHIIDVLDEQGTDAWWTQPVDLFIPPQHRGQKLTKGTDTLDVWFDSGSSWTLLEASNLRTDGQPLADVYLEGSDQHRGWFQSSLLIYLLTRDGQKPTTPYRTLIQHGFINDEAGQKMSKSAGNGLSPVEIIRGKKGQSGHGADALRLWAAKVDYPRDVSIGPSAIAQAAEMLRKTRAAMRFMLANFGSGDIPDIRDVNLSLMDGYVLDRLAETESKVLAAYEQYIFSTVIAVDAIYIFINSTLSTPYFDAIRDTLYCDEKDSGPRQAVVATLHHAFRRLLHMIAPILPHLAEEFYEALGGPQSSVFLETWRDIPPGRTGNEDLVKDILHLRSLSAKLQLASAEKHGMTGNRNANLLVIQGTTASQKLDPHQHFLPSTLGFSQVSFSTQGLYGQALGSLEEQLPTLGQVALSLWPPQHAQCPRCRLHTAPTIDRLCVRCERVVRKTA